MYHWIIVTHISTCTIESCQHKSLIQTCCDWSMFLKAKYRCMHVGYFPFNAEQNVYFVVWISEHLANRDFLLYLWFITLWHHHQLHSLNHCDICNIISGCWVCNWDIQYHMCSRIVRADSCPFDDTALWLNTGGSPSGPGLLVTANFHFPLFSPHIMGPITSKNVLIIRWQCFYTFTGGSCWYWERSCSYWHIQWHLSKLYLVCTHALTGSL